MGCQDFGHQDRGLWAADAKAHCTNASVTAKINEHDDVALLRGTFGMQASRRAIEPRRHGRELSACEELSSASVVVGSCPWERNSLVMAIQEMSMTYDGDVMM
eukprot:scaffold31182_cov72-Skeletonema_dohrnii-CCMP3373.AAC.3